MVNKSMIFWTCKNVPKRPRAPKHIFWGLEYEKPGNQIPNFEIFEKNMKFAHEIAVQNGSYVFPNELMRFRNKAKPIWVEIQKHCKMQS